MYNNMDNMGYRRGFRGFRNLLPMSGITIDPYTDVSTSPSTPTTATTGSTDDNTIWRDRDTMTGEICPVPKNSDLFILGEQIGSGSFANVYKAEDTKTKSPIAIKSYRMKKRDLGHFSRAATEMAFLRFIKHPHIISFVLCDIQKQYMYLGIEYSCHGSLLNFMKNKVGLTELTVRAVMRQLLSALTYLHSMSIFHGDVKPENIIVTDIKETLVVKLSDFGLADVVMKGKSYHKRAGSFFYMAPEIHLGFPFDYTADLYSAGVVMYEMLFATKPFPTNLSKDQYITMLRKRADVVFPRFEAGFLTPHCLNLVKNLLNYDKQNRLSSTALANHPFVNIILAEDTESHYMKACECLLRGVELVKKEQYGSGYIDVIEAILHLKININRIHNDEGLFRYSNLKLQGYLKYCSKIEERLISDKRTGHITMQTQAETLRCLLKSTAGLLSGYDVCCIGEMYCSQGMHQIGADMIKQGLDILFPNMIHEPEGKRKSMLIAKIDQWVKILEDQSANQSTTN